MWNQGKVEVYQSSRLNKLLKDQKKDISMECEPAMLVSGECDRIKMWFQMAHLHAQKERER